MNTAPWWRPFPRWPRRTVINGCVNPTPLLTRYTLLKTRWGTLSVHVFHRSDEDRECHDHPWDFWTLILRQGYLEQTPAGIRRVMAGQFLYRPAEWAHRVDLVDEKPAVTLIWMGRKRREWGFHCDAGWKHNAQYGQERDCPG